MTPMPCPFCGVRLTPIHSPVSSEPPSFGHTVGDCWLSGWSIGSDRIEKWNKRRTGVYLEMGRAKPVFHNTPETGYKPADADMLNSIVAYYEEQVK